MYICNYNILLIAIYWVTNEAEVILPCSQLAIVDTVLSQLTEISNKADFAVAVVTSLAQQLKNNYVESFIQQVCLLFQMSFLKLLNIS